jgi:hypothetical protein
MVMSPLSYRCRAIFPFALLYMLSSSTCTWNPKVPEYLRSDYFSFVVTAFSKTFLFSEIHHGDNPARKPKLKM